MSNLHRAHIKLATLSVTIGAAIVLTGCGVRIGGVSIGDTIGDPAVAVAGGNPDQGPAAMQRYGCISCHTVPGVQGANGRVGPPLNFWSERAYIAGNLPNEPDNLIQWIENPQAIEPGTAMPFLGVTDSDARNIAAYLYTLK
jgi:cytochrome c2